MEKEQLKRIFKFLEEKEGHNLPFKWKLFNNLPLTEKDLNVKGDLDLFDSKIKSLPKGLKVSGILDLFQVEITSLPDDLQVGGYLNLSNTSITSLPKGLKVGGFLYIYKSALLEYTDEELREMIKPGFIKGEIIR